MRNDEAAQNQAISKRIFFFFLEKSREKVPTYFLHQIHGVVAGQLSGQWFAVSELMKGTSLVNHAVDSVLFPRRIPPMP